MLLLLLLVLSVPAWSQADWTVTPEDYEFTMTVTGFAQIACTESHDPLNMVAAFIDGEVRGVQYFSDAVNGRQLAFMIVYDNVFSGNTVTFKLYDASRDTIIDVIGSVGFQESQSQGNSNNPYRFFTSPGVVDVLSSADEIPAELKANDIVTTFTALNTHGEVVPANYSFIDDGLGVDNHYFTLEENQLILHVDAASIEEVVMDLHILATPEDGCPFAYAFQLSFSETTSVVPEAKPDELQIYPNPSTGVVFWDADRAFDQIQVFDLQGRMILQKKLHNPGKADLSELGEGMYVFNLISKESKAARFVIRK